MIKLNPMERITSRENRRLVAARAARDGRAHGQIFIEGKRLVQEAVRSNIEIDECFVSDGIGDQGILDTMAGGTTSMAELPERIFRSIADTKEPQGVIAIARRPKTGREMIAIRDGHLPLVIFLDEINNPSNLGAILRTAEAAGVAGVIISRGSADAFSPKALRGAMGSSFRMPVWDNADFGEILDWARTARLSVCAAVADSAKNYTTVDWKKPRLLIFGSEAHGLISEQLKDVDETLAIPMSQNVESLNLAVAAGIILFEARRQNFNDSR
jgi:TrmH family RNA methyltransferase